jgi:pimeloyl-ACP methyl ester carboxylesterase
VDADEFLAPVPDGSIAGLAAGTWPPVLVLHGGPGLSDYTASLADEMPTGFVLGAESPIPPRHGTATAALIPGVRYVVEADCGHFPWIERPGSVRKALEQVLG